MAAIEAATRGHFYSLPELLKVYDPVPVLVSCPDYLLDLSLAQPVKCKFKGVFFEYANL